MVNHPHRRLGTVGQTETTSTLPSSAQLRTDIVGKGIFVRYHHRDGLHLSTDASPDPLSRNDAIGSGIVDSIAKDGWSATVRWKRWRY